MNLLADESVDGPMLDRLWRDGSSAAEFRFEDGFDVTA